MEVSQPFRSSDGKTVQLQTYTESNDGTAVDSVDISLDYGEGVPIEIKVTGSESDLLDSVLLYGVFINDGFNEQVHIELQDDGTYSVEVCDSLADVPPGFEFEAPDMEELFDRELPDTEDEKTVAVDISF